MEDTILQLGISSEHYAGIKQRVLQKKPKREFRRKEVRSRTNGLYDIRIKADSGHEVRRALKKLRNFSDKELTLPKTYADLRVSEEKALQLLTCLISAAM